jgi:cystathionine gamma-synthase
MTTPGRPRWSPRTLAAQALGIEDPVTRAVVPPIHVSTTFVRDPDNQYRSGYAYARPDNATTRHAEAVLASLEGAADAMLLASGMAAATAVFNSLPPGAHVVAPRVMYWALRSWLQQDAPALGHEVTLFRNDDLDSLRAAVRPGATRLVWLETPANPLWTVTDIAAAARIAHQAGALLAVDSTVATPVLTRPLALGADLVMHSATKYLGGHSDVVAGALACRVADEAWARIRRVRSMLGGILGPFDAYLVLRGMRTLDLRVHEQSRSAQRLAERLAAHPAVEEVLYPGLPTFPGHEVAARQMSGGFGGMISIRVKGGEQAAVAAAARVELWKRATSLGGVESLIEHRASAEGPGTPCPPDLLRLSVGLEDPDDLYADLDQSLRSAAP